MTFQKYEKDRIKLKTDFVTRALFSLNAAWVCITYLIFHLFFHNFKVLYWRCEEYNPVSTQVEAKSKLLIFFTKSSFPYLYPFEIWI